jgi:MarR family transcriptional regulator, organic hydroperoxide resistance regulator
MTTDRALRLSQIDELAAEIGWRTSSRFHERLRPYHITISQYLVLLALDHSGTAESLKTLCDRTMIPASSMTNTIDRLVEAGLIERAAHPTDRRVSVVALTDHGREMALTIQRERKEHISEVFGHLSDDDLDTFARLLQTTLERVDTESNGPAAPP